LQRLELAALVITPPDDAIDLIARPSHDACIAVRLRTLRVLLVLRLFRRRRRNAVEPRFLLSESES
jgi:hypothetical protein